jgi:hypothetical protein
MSKNDQNTPPSMPNSPNSSVDRANKRPMNNAELNVELERLERERQSKMANPINSSVNQARESQIVPKNAEIERIDERHSDSNPSTNESSSGASTSKKSRNKNALRHGGYFQGLLPWESPEEFEALHKSLRGDCKPDGVLQEEVVLTLCQWMWKRRRVVQGSEISYFRSPVAESLKTGEISWDDVVQHQSEVPQQIQALISSQMKLVESLNSVSDKIGEHYYWTNTTEGKDIQLQLAKMRSEIGSLASKVREQAFDGNKNLQKDVEKITNLFDHAYQPDEIEKQVKLLSMIDREIDKAGRRLMLLKTFKSVEAEARQLGSRAQPLLESPPVVPNEARSVEEKVKMGESTELRGTRLGRSLLQLPNIAESLKSTKWASMWKGR